MKIIVLISAIAEWNAVKPLFPDAKIRRFPFGECFDILIQDEHISFFHSGWGKIASAGSMQYVLDRYTPDLVVNLGTCGGFEGVVNQGDIILVDRTYVYDIVELMGDLDIVSYYASSLDLSWLTEPYPFPVRRGLIASADSDLPPGKFPSSNRTAPSPQTGNRPRWPGWLNGTMPDCSFCAASATWSVKMVAGRRTTI